MPVRFVRLVLLVMVAVVGMSVPATSVGASDSRLGPAPGGRHDLLRAGPRCKLVAQPTALPVGVGTSCPGLRPGALVRTPIGLCTLNFLWRGDDDGRYMGTAGHCLLEGSGSEEVSFKPGTGPVASEGPTGPDGSRRAIGRFAYAVSDDDFDFALIRLDPGVEADPSVCFFGGPTGLDDGPLPLLAGLSHVGQGRLLSGLVPARTQLVLDSDPNVIVGLGLAAPGDSGEPLLGPDGRAVGLVAATGPAALGIAGTGLVFSTRLAPQLARASQVMGVAFTLQTAPRA